MNLPHPFQSATSLKPNADGSLNLIDASGKPLARVPLATAFDLSDTEDSLRLSRGYGDGFGEGDGFGGGYYGRAVGLGAGNGNDR